MSPTRPPSRRSLRGDTDASKSAKRGVDHHGQEGDPQFAPDEWINACRNRIDDFHSPLPERLTKTRPPNRIRFIVRGSAIQSP